MKLQKFVGCLTVLLFVGGAMASADMKQLKAYKDAFPEESAKCTNCHTATMPKKDGDHAMNAYGQKVVAISATPTAETYKAAGKA